MATLEEVRAFWNRASCGEVYAGTGDDQAKYAEVSRARYAFEPYLQPFARFEEAAGKDVLEIGVGMGSDHQMLALAGPRSLHGVDLTERALEHVKARFAAFGLVSQLSLANAEKLPFPDASFDFVYSWGVIHHSPDTAQAAREILRVLRPGGVARVMIYHRNAPVGWMLWTRYALLRGRPWLSLTQVYARHLESPGTKAYRVREAGRFLPARQWSPAKSSYRWGTCWKEKSAKIIAAGYSPWPNGFGQEKRFGFWRDGGLSV